MFIAVLELSIKNGSLRINRIPIYTPAPIAIVIIVLMNVESNLALRNRTTTSIIRPAIKYLGSGLSISFIEISFLSSFSLIIEGKKESSIASKHVFVYFRGNPC